MKLTDIRLETKIQSVAYRRDPLRRKRVESDTFHPFPSFYCITFPKMEKL